MPLTPANPFLHHIRHLIGSDPAAALTDRQLLERFLANRDEMAVEVLVRRHGPLVFGVCRRVLRNTNAAEDVLQATFLVLVRKAGSLVDCKRLGGWLYRVAYRLALRARAQDLRRQHCEAQAARNRPDGEGLATAPSDLLVALEEELQKLPEKHRAPLVLCYLEGKTNEQAAQLLGCPRGSISARLAQARERLRSCLARRGHTVGSVAIAALLGGAAAEGAVPLPLLSNTVRAALWFAAEDARAASVVSSQAVALAQGACRVILVNKLRLAGAMLLAAAMLGTGATLLLNAAPQASPPAQAPGAPPPDARPAAAQRERLPRGAISRMGSRQLRHGDVASFAAYTPDGKALLTAGRDKTVRLWDLATGKEVRRFDWGQVQLDNDLQPARDQILQRFEKQFWDDTARSSQAALSADGKLVAASRGGVVHLWETATGRKLRDLDTKQQWLLQLAFSADGRSLLTLGRDQATAVWEVATGRCIERTDGKPSGSAGVTLPDLVGQKGIVSPGWQYLAWLHIGEGATNSFIRIRERATDKELFTITDAATAMTFSADEKTLIWFSLRGEIVITDVATRRELRRLRAPALNIATDIALSPDGECLAVSRADHVIDLWDLTYGGRWCRVSQACGIAHSGDAVKPAGDILGALVRPALAYSPDGKKLVSSFGGATIHQVSMETGKLISRPDNGPQAAVSTLGLSADGKALWTYGHGDPLRYWDWSKGTETSRCELLVNQTHFVFAADDCFAFADDTEVALGSAGAQETRRIKIGEVPPVALALSPDGAWLAIRSGAPPQVQVWDTKTLQKHYTLGPAGEDPTNNGKVVTETTGVVPPDLVFSADGRFLAGGGRARQLSLWDMATGATLWEAPVEAGQMIERFAFSPSGFCLAAIQGDSTVMLYEALTGAKRARLGEPGGKSRRVHLTGCFNVRWWWRRPDVPICLAFSPNGRYLAVAKDTPAIHLWDVLAGREVGQLQGHEGGVVSILFSRDGKRLFSGSTDTTALAWDLSRLIETQPAQIAKLPPPILDALWADLASKDAARAFDALCKLRASPEQAVPLLKGRLRPAAPPDAKRLARLLADLQSDRFERRRQAESELEALGELAEPALRKALNDDPPLDLRKRLERLLDELGGKMPPAEQMRDLRAVELLELIGSAEARQVLQTLGGGVPRARLTREAKSAVQRLTRLASTP
jgi:RNA polymerase sigma factor (sigma-70 family)